jgi:polysaccharide export outer membrane protein
MIRHPGYYLLALSIAAAIGACGVRLGVGTACAAEPLPNISRGTLELVSATSSLPMIPSEGPSLSPAAPHLTPAIDCVNNCPPGYEATWNALGPVAAFEQWAQGEYVGRSRLPHVPVYRLRVDDALEFDFRVDHDRISGQYKFNVGDQLTIETAADSELRRTLVVLPDGTITLPLVGRVEAAGRTVTQVRDELNEAFKKYYNEPAVSVIPFQINSQLEELRYAVGGRAGFAKQVLPGRVTPEGTIQLPAIGSVPAQGLTIDEFKMELDERYGEQIEGMEVVPVLREHGPRYVYVLGDVQRPGRYVLEAPTTVMQAITMAGGWTVGAHLTDVVVFRRADDWRLLATKVNLRAAFAGKQPCPEGDIWVGDSDLIIIPRSKIERFDNFTELVFSRGVFGVIPFNGGVGYAPFKGPFFIPIVP